MRRLVRWFTIAGWVLGAAVIFYGLGRFLTEKIVPPLLVSLSVVIAGPLEDVLKGLVRRRKRIEEDPAVTFVDQATSVGLLVLLALAIYLM